MRLLLLVILLPLMATSCIKPPEYPIEPHITFKEINTAFAKPGRDSIIVSFDFTDGDGDLGTEDGDTLISAFMVDRRTGFPYSYQIPFITPKGTTKAISGTIWITVLPDNFSCRPNRPVLDTISYEIYIVDRAGHESNRIVTPDVVLDCQ